MNPEDIVRIASVLKDDLKEAVKLGKRHEAPLWTIIDDLQDRYKGFSPKYAAYGRTLRPYAKSLGYTLRDNDNDLHEWIKSGFENLRKGSAPELASLIVYQLSETRYDFLLNLLASITDETLQARLPADVQAKIAVHRTTNRLAASLSPVSRQAPENLFHLSLTESFNLRDWEICAHRILHERRSQSGALDLSKLRIDSLPDSVGDLIWLRDFSCSVTSITKLSDIDRFENLAFLHCSYGKLRELPRLAGCKALTKITCGVTAISSITPVGSCPTMEQLFCGSTFVADLTPLRACPRLRILHCEDTLVSDLAGLEDCNDLQLLDCADTSVRSLKPIRNLPNLETLILNGCNIEEQDSEMWQSPALREVIFCRGTLKGVPTHLLSRSFDENCLPRIRSYLESGN